MITIWASGNTLQEYQLVGIRYCSVLTTSDHPFSLVVTSLLFRPHSITRHIYLN